MNKTIRVVIADDNHVVRLGLEHLLSTFGFIEVLASVENGAQAIEAVNELHPDLCILDVRMPVMNGLEALREIAPLCKVLMLTHSEDATNVNTAVKSGASGYIIYSELDTDHLHHTIESLMNGSLIMSSSASTALRNGDNKPQQNDAHNHSHPLKTPKDVARTFGLSKRETEVMGVIADGLSNKQISAQLFLSEKTIKNHVNSIFSKMQVSSRAEAVSIWLHTLMGPGSQ